MSKQTINVGVIANDRRGDPIRVAFQKTNSNFDEVYDIIESIVAPTDISDLTDSQNLLGQGGLIENGILYGSNADSGDDAGLDTIKLVPDVGIYQNGSDQYVIVDPTAPNHIHLRAGGPMDDSSADIFLGGEKNHVRVSDGEDMVYISTDNGEGGINIWEFTSDATTYLPRNLFSEVSYLLSPINDTTIQLSLGGGNGVSIVADSFSGSITSWEFETDGSLRFPDGGSLRVRNAPATSIGRAGDKAGAIALDANYVYYCTSDYTGSTIIIPWTGVGNFPQTSQVQAEIADSQLLSLGNLQITNCTVNGVGGITVSVDSYENVSGNIYAFTITVEGFQASNQNSELIATDIEALNIWKRVAFNNDTW